MTDKNIKMILTSNDKEIELLLYNEENITINEITYNDFTLNDYADFIMTLNNGEKFKVKILKSDFDRIKAILDGKGGSDDKRI